MDLSHWLFETTAADVMVRQLKNLDAGATLADAADLFLREQISGAPVVDGQGACVGVLSASDIAGAEIRVARQRQEIAKSSFWNSNLVLPVGAYAGKLKELREKTAEVAQQSVERFMTSDLVTVAPETPLATIVQHMVDAHVHRVMVVDADGRLQGLVSTTDVLAALLRAVPPQPV